jgi:hemerythrin superfamily protein
MNATKKAKEQRPQDAIALLRADHENVSALFDQFESSRSAAKKKFIAAEICKELTVHAAIEEEIFYPAAKEALRDAEMVPEALVEHDGVKKLIAEIEGSEAEGEMFDARVKVLSELVKHHVKEEQNELFPAVKKTALDLKDLGAQLAARKAELLEDASVTQ